eukprot:TRINITY_DN1464_c0_g1::TRINITY_DN1464_c0_g1_i1::g.27258::m.27258 TRINITY_DN1464_c0_g1::TRINITY_DN1464_c0_g1_i1::g.27258  ORF type:complete len:533 (-),score=100.43,BTB/PF00651.26/2.5e-09,BTB/PF00651.26/5.8e+03,BACK/PF07707.10/32,BACK/PF07707.10/2.5e-07 TRINITY_DN1464_c0_g1_i1:776-2305(-)
MEDHTEPSYDHVVESQDTFESREEPKFVLRHTDFHEPRPEEAPTRRFSLQGLQNTTSRSWGTFRNSFSFTNAERTSDRPFSYRPSIPSYKKENTCENRSILVNDLSDLSWRNGSPANFSDWRIVVNHTITYNVHKNIVGAGPRCSRVLRKIMLTPLGDKFSSNDFGILDTLAHARSTYYVSFPKRVYEHFEDILEYFYTGHIDVTVRNVVPYLHIAHTLDIVNLIVLLEDFVRKEILTLNALDLLVDMLELKPRAADAQSTFETCIVLAYGAVARNFEALACSKLACLPLDVLLSILSHEDLRSNPRHICNCVTAFLREWTSRKLLVTQDNFLSLTSFITEVPHEDALYLLQNAIQFGPEELRDRCVRTIAENFDKLNMDDASQLTLQTVRQLLCLDELNVRHEDSVFDFLSAFTRSRCHPHSSLRSLSQDDLKSLWGCCRFSYLSLHNLKQSHSDLPIPKDLVTEGLLLRSLRVDGKFREIEELVNGFEKGSLAWQRARPRRSYIEQY